MTTLAELRDIAKATMVLWADAEGEIRKGQTFLAQVSAIINDPNFSATMFSAPGSVDNFIAVQFPIYSAYANSVKQKTNLL